MSAGASGGARRRPPGIEEDLYGVLGASPGDSHAELRRRYLALAREHHPDRHAGDPEAQRRAEHEMQAVNEAWSVLGDEGSRSVYDSGLRRERRATYRPGRPSPGFVPIDDGDDPDDPAALHDLPYGDGSTVHRGLQVGPAALLGVGVLALAAGMVVDFGPLLALGVVAFVAGALAFLATPFYAVMRAHHRTRE